jgi:hypothetical protein
VSSAKLGASLPFAVAVIFYLISPLLAAKVKTVLEGQIAKNVAAFKADASAGVPPPLTPDMIKDYVDYVADAVQIVPTTMLPVVGAIFAISAKLNVNIAVIILILAIILAVTMDSLVLSRTAPDYVSRKVLGYSIVSVVGIALNLLGLGLILAFG